MKTTTKIIRAVVLVILCIGAGFFFDAQNVHRQGRFALIELRFFLEARNEPKPEVMGIFS